MILFLILQHHLLQKSATPTVNKDTNVLVGVSAAHLAVIVGGGIAIVAILVIVTAVCIVKRRAPKTIDDVDARIGRDNIVAWWDSLETGCLLTYPCFWLVHLLKVSELTTKDGLPWKSSQWIQNEYSSSFTAFLLYLTD